MSEPESVPMPSWGSRLAVRLNFLIAIALGALAILGVAMGCSGDVCLGGYIAVLLVLPVLGVLVGLAIRGLWGRSFGMALIDIALVAAVVSLSTRTILAVDIGGMLAISPFAAVPLAGGVVATREAAHGHLERWIVLVGFIALAAWFAITPEIRLGAVVPLALLPAIAFPTMPPRQWWEEPEGSATPPPSRR